MPDRAKHRRGGRPMRSRGSLARLIQRSRRAVARLRAMHLPQEQLPRAMREMHAVIHMTENAANTIMTAAEQIARVDLSDRGRAKAAISSACDQIFEACAFQDITSQRINKVLRTLQFVHSRLAALQTAWGNLSESGEPTGTAPASKHGFLAGPALDGEGLDQMQVDRLVG